MYQYYNKLHKRCAQESENKKKPYLSCVRQVAGMHLLGGRDKAELNVRTSQLNGSLDLPRLLLLGRDVKECRLLHVDIV